MSMTLDEIKKLATLSRLDINEDEMKGILKDFDAILAYVSQSQEALKLKDDNADNQNYKTKLKNVMREDVPTNNPEEYADKIIDEMPQKEGRYMKVKQIL